MDFEYGCTTVNKYAFLDENEVEDPSDLLTQAQTAATKKETTKGKDAKGKDTKGKKPAGKTDTKQPLKASDNAVKKTFDNKDGNNSSRPFLLSSHGNRYVDQSCTFFSLVTMATALNQ